MHGAADVTLLTNAANHPLATRAHSRSHQQAGERSPDSRPARLSCQSELLLPFTQPSIHSRSSHLMIKVSGALTSALHMLLYYLTCKITIESLALPPCASAHGSWSCQPPPAIHQHRRSPLTVHTLQRWTLGYRARPGLSATTSTPSQPASQPVW